MSTYIKIFGLMALMTALVVGVAGYFGGTNAMVPAFLLAAAFNFGTYWFSDRVVLKMYRAQIVNRQEAPQLFDTIDRLRRRANLPMPRVAIAPSDQPNAFATGRDPEHAVVCVTRGILQLVDPEELEGVLGHELGHVQNRDMLTNTVMATMAGAITFLARLAFFFGDRDRNAYGALAMMIVAPIAAMIVQMAVSRQMEFRADRTGASISGHPLQLANALRKLENYSRRIPMNVNPSAAHLCIVNPLRGGGIARLFRTHPPTEERIARLEELARSS